jgi:uncharacterized protein YndB with AHSA1/START domain
MEKQSAGGITMEKQSVIHNTFSFERSYPTSPERVFAAFSDPAKKRHWYAEGDHHEIVDFEMDFRVGGIERSSYRMGENTPFKGVLLTNDTTFQDIIPNRRIVLSSTMTLGDKRISSILATFEFLPTDKGTNLLFTHQGAFFEGSGGPEMREGGWRVLFDRLGKELSR